MLTPQERTRKILKKLLMFWGLGLAGAFIPVVHLILVPLCLFLGLFMAYRQSCVQMELVKGEIACPDCQRIFILQPQGIIWPLTEICQTLGCSGILRIRPVDLNHV